MKKSIYIPVFLVSVAVLTFFGIERAIADEDKKTDKSEIIKFSHAIHIAAKSQCLQCHKAMESMTAEDRILPRHEECQSCHEKEMIEDCNFCHFEDNLIALPNPERKANFSHQQHLAGQASTCEKCHQDLEKTDFASEVNLPTQATCNTCHNNVKSAN